MDLDNGVVVYTSPGFGADVHHARFSPDGTRFVYSSVGDGQDVDAPSQIRMRVNV